MGELSHIFDSPFTVAIAAMCIPIVAIISGVWSKAHSDRLKADQRLAMLARGHSLAEIEAIIRPEPEPSDSLYSKPAHNPIRSLARARRAATVLTSIGLGDIVFGIVLSNIVGVRAVLAVAAAGLIPLLIGLGFVVDYILQKRDLARFGHAIDPTRSSF